MGIIKYLLECGVLIIITSPCLFLLVYKYSFHLTPVIIVYAIMVLQLKAAVPSPLPSQSEAVLSERKFSPPVSVSLCGSYVQDLALSLSMCVDVRLIIPSVSSVLDLLTRQPRQYDYDGRESTVVVHVFCRIFLKIRII